MICYLNDVDYIFFCCNECLLDIYDYSICNKQLKLMQVIKQLHHKKIYGINENKNWK